MLEVFVNTIGLHGPGLTGWDHARTCLSGDREYEMIPAPVPKLTLLPANERRRATSLIRLALHVASEAMQQDVIPANEVCSVFSSSGGDLEIVHKISTALRLPEKPVSPTQFHNSVHNAPAGYWAIATNSRMASTSISAFDGSFSAGLLEAATHALVEDRPVLLVAYDVPPPLPLGSARPMVSEFGVALLLSREQNALTKARLAMDIGKGMTAGESRCDSSELEKIRLGNPAARSIPLLQALAKSEETAIVLPYLENNCLSIQVQPC